MIHWKHIFYWKKHHKKQEIHWKRIFEIIWSQKLHKTLWVKDCKRNCNSCGIKLTENKLIMFEKWKRIHQITLNLFLLCLKENLYIIYYSHYERCLVPDTQLIKSFFWQTDIEMENDSKLLHSFSCTILSPICSQKVFTKKPYKATLL